MEEHLSTRCDININVVDKDLPEGLERTRIKQNKKKSIKQHFLQGFENFNRVSKEVKERERTPIEKIVWLLIFLLCLSYCGCLIWKSYWKWMKSPSIVLLTENSESVLKIPFPAVTVCPERKIRTSVFSFEEYNRKIHAYSYENLTEEEQHMYEDMLAICDWSHTNIKGRKFSLGNETVANIRKVSPKLSNVIQLCQWNGKRRSCSDMFTPIFTETGLCYTFNTIGTEDLFQSDKLNTDYEYMPNLSSTRMKWWTPKNSYLPNAPLEDTYPERGSGAGAKAGLRLVLGEDIEGLDLECKGMVSGFKILLHHPTELPRLTQQYIRIPIYEEVTIAFQPKKIVTSNGLRVFPAERRQCYFTGDHNLKYFKLYTQINCEFECLSNFTYARCGCVHYSMPHGPDMKICSIGSLNCSENAEFELSMLSINRKLHQGSSNVTAEEAIQIADDCKCLPTCTSITYETEISQLELDYKSKHAYRWKGFRMSKSVKLSSVVIFFKHALFNISKRAELYSTSDILASCGGLLGLFMGFSVINIVETLYFCILRSQGALSIEAVEVEQTEEPAVLDTTRKRNKSSTKQNFLKFFNSCKLSLREARERETTPIEKIIWLLMFTSCLIYCGILIWKSYSKWIKSPAIVMLTENDEPIREIPFPAVTVCPERKIMSEVFNFQHYNKLYYNKTNVNLTQQEQNMYEDVSLICDYDRIPGNGRNVSVGNETVENILKASAGLFNVIFVCTWKGKQRACNSLFTPILTEEGMCFTFNTIGPEDLFQLENMHTDYEYMKKLNRTRNQGWTMENGYPFNAPRKTYPVRGSGAGVKAGLGLKLTEMEKGLDFACKRRLSGFKILLHNPSDLPRPSQQYIRVPTFEDVTLSFTASLEVTSDGLQVFTPQGRQCYFEDERSLKYFKLYTQSNCEYECLTNFTYARCGCVHFGMPHGPNMAICNVGSVKCLGKAEMELSTLDIEDEGRGNVTTEEAIQIADDCNCLPACTSIYYETDVTQTELHENERHEYEFVGGNNSHGGYIKKSKVSNVIIFFKRPLFDISKRSELYGTSDILASCGGLLGLFMGFSVINIVDIVYLCILSVCRRHKADKCEHPNKQSDQ